MRRPQGALDKSRHTMKDSSYADKILNTLREPFLVLDKDLRVVSANRSFYDTFKVNQQETEGQRVYDLGNGQWNIPTLREGLEQVLPNNGHTIVNFEVQHDFPGIGEKIMLLNARRVRKPGNHSELILLATEDVTEFRAAVRAMSDSEVRYRRLFQTAKDGILILDAHTGKIVDANAFMSALVGLEPNDLMGKELFEIGMYADESENRAAFRELQRTKYLRHDHLPVQHRNGQKVEVEFIANVYHEGDTLVAQCNVRDISQRVAMEKKLQHQTEQLAGESRRKDEFLAMLSHELRNPLAPIRSAVQLLKSQDRGSENLIQKQALEVIERQVANLTKLVSDLLEVSRFVSGRVRLDQQIIDMNHVIQHAIETATPLIQQRKHELLVHLWPEPVWCNGDVTRLEEVFINLLNNAAKYTQDGGRIEVRCERPPGTNFAQVRIRDNGMGIDKELLPWVFELFTQADRSLARSAGGLGIGLSLAHRIIDLHGGKIEAQSPPEGVNAGSEFIVKLALAAAPAQTRATPMDVPALRSDGMRVLVVDDNVDMVMMLATVLGQKGYSVQSAYNGPDCLTVAQQWRPDVILLDIGLPGLDGYEVTRRLRSDPTPGNAGKQMRLIALTGYGLDVDIALAHEAGFDAHLVKPYDFDQLEKLMITTTASAGGT